MPALTPFEKYGKTPRLYRDVHITEKLDGTNAQVTIIPTEQLRQQYPASPLPETPTAVACDEELIIFAGSRNRVITPGKGTDNYGFAQFVLDNAEALAVSLGVGRHYGEWYGNGIARGYDLDEKRFALFHPRWQQEAHQESLPDRVEPVPLIMQRNMGEVDFDEVISELVAHGSHASPGFMSPEGVIVRHSASKAIYKLLVENATNPDHIKDPSPEELHQ